jgi:hypothetical protein
MKSEYSIVLSPELLGTIYSVLAQTPIMRLIATINYKIAEQDKKETEKLAQENQVKKEIV